MIHIHMLNLITYNIQKLFCLFLYKTVFNCPILTRDPFPIGCDHVFKCLKFCTCHKLKTLTLIAHVGLIHFFILPLLMSPCYSSWNPFLLLSAGLLLLRWCHQHNGSYLYYVLQPLWLSYFLDMALYVLSTMKTNQETVYTLNPRFFIIQGNIPNGCCFC